MAARMLPKYDAAKDLLDDLDKAKFLLVALEIQRQLGQPVDDRELKVLFEVHKDSGDDWEKVFCHTAGRIGLCPHPRPGILSGSEVQLNAGLIG